MELFAKLVHFVPAATIARNPEQGEILADLGRRYASGIGQIIGEDSHEVQSLQPVQRVLVPR